VAAGKPRSKSVVFRIRQEEYDRLASKILENGERSFSDFARSKVLRAIGEPSLADVGQRLSELEEAVHQLTQLVIRTQSKGTQS
jgi:hypothetical protein